MPAYIHSLETATPPFAHQQEAIAELFLPRIDDRKTRMLLKRSLRGAGIDTRHSVCEKFFDGELYDEEGRASTGARNRFFAEKGRELAAGLGCELLANSLSFGADDITHVVFATCTGFTNPSLDYHLVKDLGLQSTCERTILGFMGCYSTVPALRTAQQICDSNPDAVVLVMVLELCSLHLQFEASYDSVLANSLFGDGAAAALISARQPHREEPKKAQLGEFFADIIPEGEPDMSWEIGDNGFDLVLSNRVPQLIEDHVGNFVRKVVNISEIDHWAVHPGGKGILEKFEKSVPLERSELADSYAVLRRYGNMAGATLLFVLNDLLHDCSPGEEIFAIAFGPGLTVEACRLQSL